MKDLKGKRLLVLGKTYSVVNVVKAAKRLGVYVVTTNRDKAGDASLLADADIEISTNDYPALIEYIKANQIDGVMTGASEFNILNMIRLCHQAGLPVYATEEQWNLCQDKKNFKELCKKYQIPVVPEYKNFEEVKAGDYPVIVKPIDGCSSRGITVCNNEQELIKAVEFAKESSPTGQILIEKYIVNGGTTNMVKYVAVDGEYYLEAMGDRFVIEGGLITAFTIYPSLYLDYWLREIDSNIRQMLKGIGFNNGVIAFQTIPDGNNIYVYECCLRITGGMTYKMTSATSGNNSLEMLLSYALTGKMCEVEDLGNIDPHFKGMYGSSLAVPLKIGVIDKVSGLEKIASLPEVVDCTVFYKQGDEITPKNINTLDQLFARIMVVCPGKTAVFESLKKIRQQLSVKDTEGNDMILWNTFDNIYNNNVTK